MRIDLRTKVTLLPIAAELRYANGRIGESIPCPMGTDVDEFLRHIKAAMIAKQQREESENASQ